MVNHRKLPEFLDRHEDPQSPQRYPVFAAASLLAFFAMVGFGIYNLARSNMAAAAPGLSIAAVTVGLFLISLKTRRHQIVYLIGIILVDCYLIYLVMLGGEGESLLYWFFCIPLISFFMLGVRLGSLSSLLALAGALAVVTVPWSGTTNPAIPLETVVVVRFTVTYLLIGLLSLVYEKVRARRSSEATERLERLEQANARIAGMSVTDALTGCHNRQFYYDRFPDEIEQAVRETAELSLVLCEIDFFRKVTDSYGDQAGEVVLTQVAATLQQSLRGETDWIARIGTMQFAVVLPETTVDVARNMFERARGEIESLTVQTPRGPVRVTGSFGISGLMSKDDTMAEIHGLADRRLYFAKESGHNMVVSESPGATAAHPAP